MEPADYVYAALVEHGAEVQVMCCAEDGRVAFFQVTMPDGQRFPMHIYPE